MPLFTEFNLPTLPGGYRATRFLGRGAFGDVWEAEAPGGVMVAVKIVVRTLRPREAEREEEALKLIKSLRHPFLLGVLAYFSHADQLVIVLELAGSNLSQQLAAYKKQGGHGIPAGELLGYLREIAEGVDYLHEQNVQHRDLKPDNFLLVGRHIKVADYGLARALEKHSLQTASSSGTPAFMAPEVWQGKISPHSDQYSLAIAYMKLRFDRYPFRADNYFGACQAHMLEMPNLDGLSNPEREVLLRALAKDPRQRFPSCLAFVSALAEASDTGLRMIPETTVLPQATKATRDGIVPAAGVPTARLTPARRFDPEKSILAELVEPEPTCVGLQETQLPREMLRNSAFRQTSRRRVRRRRWRSHLVGGLVLGLASAGLGLLVLACSSLTPEERGAAATTTVDSESSATQVPAELDKTRALPPAQPEKAEVKNPPPAREEYVPTSPHLAFQFHALGRSTAELHMVPPRGQPEVTLVIPGGGAERLGLRKGDVILRVNEQETVTVDKLSVILSNIKPGDRVKITVLRETIVALEGVFGSNFDDAEEARRVRALAEQDPVAQLYLGSLYEKGRGVAKDEAEAARWYRKAAEQGLAEAQTCLGLLYANGRGVPRDDVEALRWYCKAAEQGQAQAAYLLGGRYETGRGVAKDEAAAFAWYRQAAEQGHANAQCCLGWMYANGRGVTRNDEESVNWYRQAAEQGHLRAQSNLGWMVANGRGVPRDDAEAVRLYRMAAEKSYAPAQNHLGWMYEHGRGVPRDVTEAVQWYRKAAEQGNADGQNNLGRMYAAGLGVTRDLEEAVRWYRRAADQGNALAQYNLGNAYEAGRGVMKDEAEAARWYRKAAEQGYAGAQCCLGYLYEHGRGVKEDAWEAVQWYRKAGEQGLPRAQYLLGMMYANGRGVAKDRREAVHWLRKAADQNYEPAKKALETLDTSVWQDRVTVPGRQGPT